MGAAAHADGADESDGSGRGALHAHDGGDDDDDCDESGASLKTVKQSKEVRRSSGCVVCALTLRVQHFADGFGGKTIGNAGTFALLLNNVTGPGMIQLSYMYQKAGWLSSTVMLLVCAFIGAQSGTMLSEAMTKLPGNDVFQSRAEIISLSRFYLGRSWLYGLSVFLLIFSLLSVNIASIIISAQQMDATLIAIYGTCALIFYPHPGAQCVKTAVMPAQPFGTDIVMSLGFVVVLLVAIPMGYFNLDDNIIVQQIAVLMLLTILGIWLAFFAQQGVNADMLPVWGTDQTSVVGTVLFNYTFVTSIPSWVNEKKPGVSISRSINGTTAVGTVIFLLLGVLGAMTFPFDDDTSDLLKAIETITSDTVLTKMAHVTVYMFPVVAFLSSIPVFAIIIRYNLLQNRICGKAVANFVAVVLPWLVSLPFYTGRGLSLVITWSSLVANGLINYVVPLWFFYLSRDESANRERTHRFVDILKEQIAAEAAERRTAAHKAALKRAGAAGLLPADVHVPPHEPTASEVQLALIEASIAEQKRIHASIQRTSLLAINDVDAAPLAAAELALHEGECHHEAEDSIIYGVPEAKEPFVAWPWHNLRHGRVAAIVMIVLTLVLNVVAIGVAIYLCAALGKCN